MSTYDVIVIGLPFYNFALPSTLKAYFDHVARAGVTFRYTESGSVGLLTGKKVYVIATRGGVYAGGPGQRRRVPGRGHPRQHPLGRAHPVGVGPGAGHVPGGRATGLSRENYLLRGASREGERPLGVPRADDRLTWLVIEH